MKHATVEESLSRVHGVRSGKIKLTVYRERRDDFVEFNTAYFRETQELLCISHAMSFITDVEFLLLCEENKSDNLDFPHEERPSFFLQDTNEAECKANFRIEKHHITRLEDALQISAMFKCGQGTVCDGTEGLCIVLKRFAYPCHYSDMIPIFGRKSV